MLSESRLQELQDEIAIEMATQNKTANNNTEPDIFLQDNYRFDFTQPATDNLETHESLIRPSNTQIYPDRITPLDYNAKQVQEHNENQQNDDKLLGNIRNKIDETFVMLLNKYKYVDPTTRPSIPKQKTSKKLARIVHYINQSLLPVHIPPDSDFHTIQNAIYCGAATVSIYNGYKIMDQENNASRRKKRIPKWQMRLEDRISNLRVKIGRLTEYINGNTSTKLKREIEKIRAAYRIHSLHEHENKELAHFLDTLKQKLSSLANRLRRYKETTLRKQQNALFYNNEKSFYRNLTNTHDNNDNNKLVEIPETELLHQFWSNIWSTPKTHRESDWIKQDRELLVNLPEMMFDEINMDLLTSVINKTHSWKATGTDKIHNYWYKKFTCLHPLLLSNINTFIKTPELLPSYITLGTTYMLPKDRSDSKNPAKYRPITCLQNIYKIITSCLSQLIYKHAISQNILAEQQKGCRKGSLGCKEQLIIDAVVSKQAVTKKRNIFTMFIDYKKAFDSVPHSWLIYILEHYKIHPQIIEFLKNAMLHWRTTLKLYNGDSCLETDIIAIRRGIFQGDALSPLWFCLALNPLSNLLNRTDKGYKITNGNTHHTLSHLLYMDDIKLYASSLKDIHILADITESYSTDIQMEFGINKCRIQSIRRGKSEQNLYTLQTGETIEPVDEVIGYKYLGFTQTRQIHQKQVKKTLEKEFKLRLNRILNTHLNARNIIKAVNTFAIPILTYSFGIIHWSKSNLIKLQRLINTTMTKYRQHHPRSCNERLTLPKLEGGRGLIDIKNLHNSQISAIRNFFHQQANNSALHNAVVQADSKLTPLNLKDQRKQKNESIISAQDKINSWLQKTLHGRHRRDLMNTNVDKIASNMWLKRGELFPETEGFMLAIQDQTIHTLNYRKHIIKDHTLQSDLCRHCHNSSETIQHITGACSSITQTDYKHRHDQVAAIIHQYLAYKYNLIDEKIAYYKYKPEIILDSREFKLYWDRTILTDKTVHYNRPDITLHDKKNESVYLIDIAIPNTHNLTSTYNEKIAKYTDLSIEIKSQWKVKTVKTVPIIISATGVIPRSLFPSLKDLDIHKLTFILLQKAAILNTCRIKNGLKRVYKIKTSHNFHWNMKPAHVKIVKRLNREVLINTEFIQCLRRYLKFSLLVLSTTKL
ncbi:unnamed protein product [Parnassius mnemosyne]|uniref:Reverse transcriptase domain-containing protein n=1 Tax=Parnassius mnemosyne TaxID=213953 RepID=A0AAV1L452_9NEOP